MNRPRSARTLQIAAAFACFFAALPAYADPAVEIRAKLDAYTAAEAHRAEAIAALDSAAVARYEAEAESALDAALALAENARLDRAKDHALIELYADLRIARGDHDLAAEALERAADVDPKNPRLWAKLGECLARVAPARRRDAVDALFKAIDLGGDTLDAARARYALGDLYWREGLYDLAREQFQAARELLPEDAPPVIQLAILDARDGKILEASEAIDALGAKAQPHDAEIRVRLRQALADFDAARRWIPDTPEQHAAYARLLYRAARLPDAILAARRVTQLRKDDTATWNFIAAMQTQLGNLPQAKEAYESSLAADPNQPQIRAALSALAEQTKSQR